METDGLVSFSSVQYLRARILTRIAQRPEAFGVPLSSKAQT